MSSLLPGDRVGPEVLRFTPRTAFVLEGRVGRKLPTPTESNPEVKPMDQNFELFVIRTVLRLLPAHFRAFGLLSVFSVPGGYRRSIARSEPKVTTFTFSIR